MAQNETMSCPLQKGKPTETQEIVQDIYFGIFFDGTNNNKLQVMLGKRYRRDECLKSIIEKAKKCEYSWDQIQFLIEKGIINGEVMRVGQRRDPDDPFPVSSESQPLTRDTYEQLKKGKGDNSIVFQPTSNGNALVQVDRTLWETPRNNKYTDGGNGKTINDEVDVRGRGILTQSQIDELYFGYETDDNKYFVEERISRQLDDHDHSANGKKQSADNIGWDRSEKTEHFSFASPKADVNKKIKQDADSFRSQYSGKEKEIQTNYKSPSQGSTYTNVVILESLYDASLGIQDDGKTQHKFYSIYVEGSGTDMDFRSVPAYLHIGGDGLFGLGKGTGGSGTVAKVRKVSRKVRSIVKGFASSVPKLSFDIYGFSRGATAARMYNYLLDPDNSLKDRLNTVHKWNLFEKIGLGLHDMNDYKLLSGEKERYLGDYDRTVRFLGIYDTVSSIGVFREEWLVSSLKVAAVNALGIGFSALDSIVNKSRDLISKGFDYGSSLFVKALYESIKNPITFAKAFLMGVQPDFFIETRHLGNEEVLNSLLSKYPALKDTSVDTLRTQLQKVRVEVVEKYENYVNGKYLSNMAEPDLPIFGKSKYHDQNVYDYGLFATNTAEEVFHICALDELRSNFALVDIQNSLGNGLELFLPGCHTDIGGGCSLGRDGTKIANIAHVNGSPNFICRQDAFDKNKMEYVPMSSLGLMASGWIDAVNDTFAKGSFFNGNRPTKGELKNEGTIYTDNSDSWIHVKNLIMNRYVNPGYSNIGLHLMQVKANKKCSQFKEIPKSYDVPKPLAGYYRRIESKLNVKGRYFVRPSKALYNILRSDWLHFSSNDQLLAIADNLIVNPPNYVSAYYSRQNENWAQDHVFLYGSQLNFEKQEHPAKKIVSNFKSELKTESWATMFINITLIGQRLVNMKDVMLATRIIYTGEEGKRDVRDRKYMFDYCPSSGNIINVASSDYVMPKEDEREKYVIVLDRLARNKKLLDQHVILCQDSYDFMVKGGKEELYFIEKNAVLLAANNLSAVAPEISNEQLMEQIKALLAIHSASSFVQKDDLGKTAIAQTNKIVYRTATRDEISVNDAAEVILKVIFEAEERERGYEEASSWFIEHYTSLRDWICGWLIPLGGLENRLPKSATNVKPIKMAFGSSNVVKARANGTIYGQILVNSPEIGKILGHSAALIHVLQTAKDWQKEKQLAESRVRAIKIQMEELEKDCGVPHENTKRQMEMSAQLIPLQSGLSDGNYVIYEGFPQDSNPITRGEGYKIVSPPE